MLFINIEKIQKLAKYGDKWLLLGRRKREKQKTALFVY